MHTIYNEEDYLAFLYLIARKGADKLMDETAFEHSLNELVKEMGTIPSPRKKKLIIVGKKSSESQKQLRNGISRLQDSLDYLRVSIKYILFDLESTRRENTYLRKMLEEKNK